MFLTIQHVFFCYIQLEPAFLRLRTGIALFMIAIVSISPEMKIELAVMKVNPPF